MTCTCWWNCPENQRTNGQLGPHLLVLIRVGLSLWFLTTFYWSGVFICLDPTWNSSNCNWTYTFGPDVTLMWTKCIDYIHIHKLESSYLMLPSPVVLTVNRSVTLDCCRTNWCEPNLVLKRETQTGKWVFRRKCLPWMSVMCPSEGNRCHLMRSLLCQPVQVWPTATPEKAVCCVWKISPATWQALTRRSITGKHVDLCKGLTIQVLPSCCQDSNVVTWQRCG